MKIKIESQIWYGLDELIKYYPQLIQFGFEIEKYIEPNFITIKDKDGSDVKYEYDCTCRYTPYIHIDTIDDMFKLGAAIGKNLTFHDDQKCIVIADD